MKVVLRSDIANIGKRGDICEVTLGYARNYLFPKGLALKATDGTVSQAQSMRRARDLRDAADRSSAETVASSLVSKVISISAKAGTEGRLFGSVTAGDIAAAVASQTGANLDKRHFHLDAIKSLGLHSVNVRLHADVSFPLQVEVVAK